MRRRSLLEGFEDFRLDHVHGHQASERLKSHPPAQGSRAGNKPSWEVWPSLSLFGPTKYTPVNFAAKKKPRRPKLHCSQESKIDDHRFERGMRVGGRLAWSCFTSSACSLICTATPELTRGNRKSLSYEFTWELTSKVVSHYRSRSQWLQLPNPNARQGIHDGSVACRVQGCRPHAKLPSQCYRGTSLIRNTPLLGPYGRTLPMVVLGGGV